MRVVVVEPIGQGGLVHYSFGMCGGLARKGADVTLVTSTHYELRELEHGFTVDASLRLWDARRRSRLPTPVRAIRRVGRGIRYVIAMTLLTRRLARERPDVVMFGEIRFAVDRWFIRRLAAADIVLADIVHDVEPFNTGRRADAVLVDDVSHLMGSYALFDVLFVHGPRNRERFIELYGISPHRVIDIPLGLDVTKAQVRAHATVDELRDRLALDRRRPVVLFFGTVTRYKGVEDLLRAFGAIRDRTGAALVIAGYPANDVDPDELESLVDDLGLADDVAMWLDYIPNGHVAALMEMAKLVVLPYRAISDSAVLKLAMMFGRPIVATAVGGIPDVIDDGVSGMLVAPGDAAGLVDSCVRILEDEELAHQIGSRARTEAFERYGWDAIAPTVLAALGGCER